MILSFKKQFRQSILDGTKIHTIRQDKPNRWRASVGIHFATGVRTSKYNCFKKGVCTSIQQIKIKWDKDYVCVFIDGTVFYEQNSRFVTQIEAMRHFALNDGFSSTAAFFEWFSEDFAGKIIHWTDFKY